MTKKHFKAVAEIIREIEDFDIRVKVALQFVDLFRSENPRFDQQRFMDAAHCN